jgi:hypothetical protein
MGWSAHWDAASGCYYYQNDTTFHTQWELPQINKAVNRMPSPVPDMRQTVQLAPITHQAIPTVYSPIQLNDPLQQRADQSSLNNGPISKKKEKKQLSKLSKSMGLNKDYAVLSHEAEKQQKYRFGLLSHGSVTSC